MSYIIYQHRNKLNNKSYVGRVISKKGMMSRWKRHVNDALKQSSSIFHRAIVSYGISDDVWEHTILQIVKTSDEANQIERDWIAKLMCNGLRENHNGYNMTDGGGGVSGYKHSIERRRKISKATLGKKRSEITRNRMQKPKSKEHRILLQKNLENARKIMHEKFGGKSPNAGKSASKKQLDALYKIAQLPHVKEAKRQAQLRRWAKWREEKSAKRVKV